MSTPTAYARFVAWARERDYSWERHASGGHTIYVYAGPDDTAGPELVRHFRADGSEFPCTIFHTH